MNNKYLCLLKDIKNLLLFNRVHQNFVSIYYVACVPNPLCVSVERMVRFLLRTLYDI